MVNCGTDGTSAKVKLKKYLYLYITGPLLCCRWIERDLTTGSSRGWTHEGSRKRETVGQAPVHDEIP